MATTIAAPKKAPAAQEDFLPLEGTDHIEFYVGNAKQAAHFYKSVFGFQSLAYAGPETGIKDRASYAIRQDKLTFVLTTPIRDGNPIAEHIQKHGDGVKVIALKVKDATSAWKETTKRGGKSYMEPKTLKDDHGKIVLSGIHTYGEVVHVFVERDDYTGPFMPTFVKWEPSFRAPETGVQHIAMATNNIIETITALQQRGLEFLKVPSTYYDTLLDRVGHIDEELSALKRIGILVDRDDEGYLLQIFTKPVEDRPTLFFEIIQRKGAKSFGKGNFKALFEALEKEQERRGNLKTLNERQDGPHPNLLPEGEGTTSPFGRGLG